MKLRSFVTLIFLVVLSSPCAAFNSVSTKRVPFLEMHKAGHGRYFFRPKETMLRFTPKEIEEISHKIAMQPWRLLEESSGHLYKIARRGNALEGIRRTLCRSQSQDDDVAAYYNEYHKIMEQFCDYDADNPLFLLEECRSKGCPLHRRKDPNICPREKMSELIDAIPDPGTSIIFDSPGGCFFEASVIERLKMQGKEINNIILIEPFFKPYFMFLTEKNINHSHIDELDLLQLPPLMTFFLLRIFQWLALVPQLAIYASIDDYLLDSQKQEKPKLAVAMDYFDTNLDEMEQAFHKLQLRDLLKHGIAPEGHLVYGLDKTLAVIENKAQTLKE